MRTLVGISISRSLYEKGAARGGGYPADEHSRVCSGLFAAHTVQTVTDRSFSRLPRVPRALSLLAQSRHRNRCAFLRDLGGPPPACRASPRTIILLLSSGLLLLFLLLLAHAQQLGLRHGQVLLQVRLDRRVLRPGNRRLERDAVARERRRAHHLRRLEPLLRRRGRAAR